MRLFQMLGAGMALAYFLPAAEAEPRAIELPSIHNAFDLGGGVYSGSAPDNETGFAALARLGVKTIISVDGAKPDVETARKFGLRYVHLPVGYGGIPAERELALAKAAATLAAPIFVHCHHGQHRGPAAAAIICESKNGWTAAQAVAWLKQAGTAADYAGLYRDVREFRAPDAAMLAKISPDLPEIAATPPLVDVMVEIDERFDLLKAIQTAGWREVPGHAKQTPAQAATLLWEQLRELSRSPEAQKCDADFRTRLTTAENAASELIESLRTPTGDNSKRDTALQRVGQSCAACHKTHRN